MNDNPVSKILVLDNSRDHILNIKRFCHDNNLVPLKIPKGRLMAVLRTNIDLGGILYSESYAESPEEAARIALEIHGLRPELPMIFRSEASPSIENIPGELRHVFCAAYVASDLSALRGILDEFIFCFRYPNALLRGIAELTLTVMRRQLPYVSISMDTPYIVNDRVIFGELLSLIPLESSWCRGYMMLQVEEAPFLDSISPEKSSLGINFRTVNDLLSETTNLIWGSFKNRFIGDVSKSAQDNAQVPLVVNHKHRYISFGTDNPQLCFRFNLKNRSNGRSSMMYERFIFNLSWSPENFQDSEREIAGLVEAGELQLF
jgi:Chemotaxis phosphatase CheX